MANNLYYGRGTDEDNKKLISFLDEVFFTDDPDERDFFNLLPKCYKDEYRPAYNNFVVQDEHGEFRSKPQDRRASPLRNVCMRSC